jgi:predicted outer membrane lipoprotein
LSTQNDSEPVGVTVTPTSVIGFELPTGIRSAQIGIFAETVEDFERIRSEALRHRFTVDDVTQYDRATGYPYTTCGWTEGSVWISMHAPRGYGRPESATMATADDFGFEPESFAFLLGVLLGCAPGYVLAEALEGILASDSPHAPGAKRLLLDEVKARKVALS